jgi:hypothetical protein
MSELNSIINVTINRLTKPIGQAGFGTPLIVGPNATFVERIKFYTENEMVALAAALTGGTAAMEYLMADTIFSQTPHVNQIAIGKKVIGDTAYEDALNAILLESNDFYGVLCAVRTTADQKSVAKWVQANGRACILSSDDANIIGQTESGDTTSIAHEIKHNAYDRTTVIYHAEADTECLDAGSMGYLLALQPGSYTGAFKTFAGCSTNKLNATQTKNAHDKYCSTYEEIAERNMLLFGWTGSGEYFDIIVFADWVKARLTENNFKVLANAVKNPFTDAGITAHENATRQILQMGIDAGGFSPMSYDKTTGVQTGGYSTTFPKSSSISAIDKAARSLTNCKFKGWLAGAIHTVAIEGTIAFE